MASAAHSAEAKFSPIRDELDDPMQDYGRASFDVRNRLFVGGTISLPHAFRVSPFMIANSGTPFNIIVGQDLNGDSIFNDRPALATTAGPGGQVIVTPYGTFNTVPVAGQTIVPINYGTGPALFSFNLRLSKTFSWALRPKVRQADRAAVAAAHAAVDWVVEA